VAAADGIPVLKEVFEHVCTLMKRIVSADGATTSSGELLGKLSESI